MRNQESTYFLKFFLGDELVIIAWLDNWFLRSSGVADLLLENSLVFLEDLLNQSVFSNSRWAHQDEWLASQWSWVERMEIFLRVNINIILLRKVTKFKTWYLRVCAKAHYSRNRWVPHGFLGGSKHILRGIQ